MADLHAQSAGRSAEHLADLLLADLHLPIDTGSQPAKASLNEAFLLFCAGPARQAQRVFLLGDVFESWVGDDLGLCDYPREIAALQALTQHGVALYYQTGNRDFLLGRGFEQATGATRLADEHIENLASTPTLLAHGDQYCTDDRGYQRWRRFSRNRLAQWLFLKLPARRRRRIAGGLREGSTTAKRAKSVEIMDVNAHAIAEAFARNGVAHLIHGHTHRPAAHVHRVDGHDCRRTVLADWRPDRLEWLRVDARGWHRQTLQPQQ